MPVWAVLSLLQQAGCQVQSFSSRAAFGPHDGALAITGREPRHLDSWLMCRDACRQMFQWNCRDADLAVVQGEFGTLRDEAGGGGSLDQLCEWLELPRLAIIPVRELDPCALRTPVQPVDAILLDAVDRAADLARWATILEVNWQAPVVGALGAMPDLRATVERLPAGVRPPEGLCRCLGTALAEHCRVEPLVRLASVPFAGAAAAPFKPALATAPRLRVAVALDEAFHCYFADTLDALEALGLELRTFSPLRSATLPADTDIVYFGCGHVEQFAEALAANHCLKLSIQGFAARGGRIYAEGGGLAYLCRRIVIDAGRRYSMVGVLPASATLELHPPPPRPAVIRLQRTTWLGPAFQELRGYVNSRWRVAPWGATTDLASEPEERGLLICHRNVIASRLHTNFAVQPAFLERFVHPLPPSPVLP